MIADGDPLPKNMDTDQACDQADPSEEVRENCQQS